MKVQKGVSKSHKMGYSTIKVLLDIIMYKFVGAKTVSEIESCSNWRLAERVSKSQSRSDLQFCHGLFQNIFQGELALLNLLR